MLFDIVIGDRSDDVDVSTCWVNERDQYGNALIVNDSIYKRVKIDQSIATDWHMNLALEGKSDEVCVRAYEIPRNVKWVNNNKNMNPMLIAKNETDESEQLILYLTVKADYKVLEYSTKYRILQTYKKAGKYQGCTVVLNKDDIKDNDGKSIIQIKAKNLKTNKFEIIDALFNIDGEDDIQVSIVPIDNKNKLYSRLSATDSKYTYSLSFKIRVKKSEFLTCTYLVSPDNYDNVKELVKNIKNNNVVVVNEDTLNNEEKLMGLLTSELVNKRIRAVTTVGIKLDKKVIKETKQLYVFNYDTETGYLQCTKSN